MYKMRLIFLVLIELCAVALLFCPHETTPSYINEEEVVVQTSNIMFETVAHLPEEDFPNCTLVWSDTINDRAVYVRNDYVPTTSLKVGDMVSFNDIDCNVVDIDEQGIAIQLPNGRLAAHGMSGSQVTYNGVPVALVSKALDADIIYCILL